MKNKKALAWLSLAVFCLLTLCRMGVGANTLLNYIEWRPLFYVLAGAGALALAKQPADINVFLHYCTRTAWFSGALCALIELIVLLANVNLVEIAGDTLAAWRFYIMAFYTAALPMFYALLFSGLAYALRREEEPKRPLLHSQQIGRRLRKRNRQPAVTVPLTKVNKT